LQFLLTPLQLAVLTVNTVLPFLIEVWILCSFKCPGVLRSAAWV